MNLHCSTAQPARTLGRRFAFAVCLSLFAFVGFSTTSVTADAPKWDPLNGYSNYKTLQRRVRQLAKHDLVTSKSLGRTIEGGDVWLLTIGIGDVDKKPAIAIVGDVDAASLVGSELSLRLAKQLTERSDEEEIRSLLERFTIYIIPRPSPDANEKCFATPRRHPAGNARKTDDDRDHVFGEDPPEDLNGDGLITMMRVADVTGNYRRHDKDPRVLITVDHQQGEKGEYRLYLEGVDNDQDGRWNEDAGDGVAFNRNFTFNYPFRQANAGRHQVSENETRAVADFLFDATNVAAVLSFTPEDNLLRTWETGRDPTRIPVFFNGGDLNYFKHLSEDYSDLVGGVDGPAPRGKGAGSFSEWAYFHYGRWSLATPGWWIPTSAGPDSKPGQADVDALKWLDSHNAQGFVEWKAFDHPDFPGKQVEIGGFKPFAKTQPPASQLNKAADQHFNFLKEVLGAMPKISIHDAEVTALGAGVFRIKAAVVNTGYLPTSAEMGRRTRLVNKVQIALELPEGAKLLRGPIRTQLQPIAGSGGQGKHSWLIRFTGDTPTTTTIRAWAPAVGETTHTIELK